MIAIRPLTRSDLPALLELYTHLHRSDDPLPSLAIVEAVWSEILASERYRYFGGFLGDVLVSSCAITIIPNLTRGCRPYGLIENVVTHAAHRKQGYGTALLHEALSYAWSVGCYKVALLTGRKDEATLHFYQSAGFDPNDKQAFVAKPAAGIASGK
jgi:GNAT superfamily N-acetyltransferase